MARADGRSECACVTARRPCLGSCPHHAETNPFNSARLTTGEVVSELSACARAHLPLVCALTPEQLAARYPLACIERWGNHAGEHSVADGRSDVPLRELLGESFDGCEWCAADGEQHFCFCMGTAVNNNLVEHCTFCGRCFYECHEFSHCALCRHKEPDVWDDARSDVNAPEALWAFEEPSWEARGLAREGYWGY